MTGMVMVKMRPFSDGFLDVKHMVTYQEGITASLKLLVNQSIKELTELVRHGT